MATLRPATGPVCRITIPKVGRDKSFVDDLNKERGTVSMRVAFVLRSAEVQPLFRLICALALVVPIVVLQTALADSPPPPAIRLRPPSLT